MKPSGLLTGFAVLYLGMVLLKDGTIPTLEQALKRETSPPTRTPEV